MKSVDFDAQHGADLNAATLDLKEELIRLTNATGVPEDERALTAFFLLFGVTTDLMRAVDLPKDRFDAIFDAFLASNPPDNAGIARHQQAGQA